MDSIVALTILFIIPIALSLANKKLFKRRLNSLSISAISALIIYGLILVSVAYIEHKLDMELAAFDLNGDGIFSGDEITPNQEAAMSRVISDAGRSLAPFTAAIFSCIYFLVTWFMFAVISRQRSEGN